MYSSYLYLQRDSHAQEISRRLDICSHNYTLRESKVVPVYVVAIRNLTC